MRTMDLNAATRALMQSMGCSWSEARQELARRGAAARRARCRALRRGQKQLEERKLN